PFPRPLPRPTAAALPPPTERYVERREISATPWSRLFEATDARLGRAVVLEEFAAPLEAHLPLLRALARAGGPHFQRLLRIDNRTVVYEAIEGTALLPPLDATAHATVVRALAPLHAEGHGHGPLGQAIALSAAQPVVRIAGP